ncbi:MAG: hypothetical protein ACKVS6_06185 [Planctomycetota bacterium]
MTLQNNSANIVKNSVERLRRRAIVAEYLTNWLFHFAIAVALAGAAALCLRVVTNSSRTEASLLFALAAVTPLSAWFASRHKFMSYKGAVAWLDLRAGSTGLLITDSEINDPNWKASAESLALEQSRAPKLRISKPILRMLAAVLFAIAAIAVPVSRGDARGNEVSARLLEQLDEKLKTLEEEVRLEEKTAEELHQKIERAKEQIGEVQAETAYETVDRIQEKISEQAEKATESAEQIQQSLSEASKDATNDPSAAQEQLEQALAELNDSGLIKGLEEELSQLGIPENLELPEGLKLDPAQLEKMSEALKEALKEKLQKMAKDGLLSKRESGKLASGKPGDKQIDWSKLQEHECEDECEEGGT